MAEPTTERVGVSGSVSAYQLIAAIIALGRPRASPAARRLQQQSIECHRTPVVGRRARGVKAPIAVAVHRPLPDAARERGAPMGRPRRTRHASRQEAPSPRPPGIHGRAPSRREHASWRARQVTRHANTRPGASPRPGRVGISIPLPPPSPQKRAPLLGCGPGSWDDCAGDPRP